MTYILYNELSNRGKPLKVAKKLEKKYLKKDKKVVLINIITAKENTKELISRLTKEDEVILLGGDGTIHRFFNHMRGINPPCRVFFRSCGRGNDFARDYKKNKVFEITNLINNMPVVTINSENDIVFANGVGMGVDSQVCIKQLENAENGIKKSYFKIAIEVFKTFKPYSLDIVVDGVNHHFDNVWLFTCNNGRFFGGGMKITPQSIREDDLLEICVIHDIKLPKLLCIFPTIFPGWHVIFKKPVTMISGKHVIIKPCGCDVMQHDGEVSVNVNELEIKR